MEENQTSARERKRPDEKKTTKRERDAKETDTRETPSNEHPFERSRIPPNDVHYTSSSSGFVPTPLTPAVAPFSPFSPFEVPRAVCCAARCLPFPESIDAYFESKSCSVCL